MTMQPSLVLAALALAVVAVPAQAQDHDAQLWTSATATVPASGTVDATLELHSRYTDEVSRLGQLLIRPSMTLKLGGGWSVTGGYVYARTQFAGTRTNDEHRSWEQVGYTFAQDVASGLAITGRTRMEQRFREEAGGVGCRLRQQVRAQLPIPGTGPVRAVVFNETFVGLNETRWGQRTGVDQVRTFIGASVAVARGVAMEPGYLNQTIFRPGSDRVNHILAANVVARF